MNPVRLAAVGTVTLALILYAIGIVKEQRGRRATGAVRAFLTLGVASDITATALMVIATGSFAATLHGALGYSALTLMFIDTVLLWRHWAAHRLAEVPRGLHLYSRIAFLYWVLAYFTGAALVMGAKRATADHTAGPPAASASAAAARLRRSSAGVGCALGIGGVGPHSDATHSASRSRLTRHD
jgi:hypothetical protein